MTREERERLRSLVDRRRREVLAPSNGQPRRPAGPVAAGPRRASTRDPVKQAGRSAVARMRAAFERLHVATQAEAAREAGVGRGTITWAARALVAEGVIAATGGERCGSPEFVYVVTRRTQACRVSAVNTATEHNEPPIRLPREGETGQPFDEYLYAKLGPSRRRRFERLMLYLHQWDRLNDELVMEGKGPPTVQEYSWRWKVPISNAYRAFADFRETFPTEEDPGRILGVLWDGIARSRKRHVFSVEVVPTEAARDAKGPA